MSTGKTKARAKDTKKKAHLPRAESVVHRLRSDIVRGRFKPGERLRQEEIARECGTSRIPVRQALHQLQNEGLVTWTSHVGARVAALNLDELDEIYQIRERLEPFALAQSVLHLEDRRLRELRDLQAKMEEVASAREPSRWIQLDRRLHLTSYSSCSLPRLIAMIDGLWNTTQQYRRAYAELPERIELAHAEHRLILEAIERRDPDDAARLQLTHIRRTRLTLDEHPEIFASD